MTFVKCCTTKVGETAVHIAADNGKLDVIQCLVKYKADPNQLEEVLMPHIGRFLAWFLGLWVVCGACEDTI